MEAWPVLAGWACPAWPRDSTLGLGRQIRPWGLCGGALGLLASPPSPGGREQAGGGPGLVSTRKPRTTRQSITMECWQVHLQQTRPCHSAGKHTGPEKLQESLTASQKTETKKWELLQHRREPQAPITSSVQSQDNWS